MIVVFLMATEPFVGRQSTVTPLRGELAKIILPGFIISYLCDLEEVT